MSTKDTNGNSGGGELEECPTCGRDDFASEQGVKLHHKKTHGESLAYPELECEWCGDSYTVHSSKAEASRFCSHECRGEWESAERVGENHPAYDRVTLVCKQCGGEYERPPSIAEGSSFCSNACQHEWLSGNVDNSGENHPGWKGGEATLTCETCGEAFSVKPHRANDARFCSRKCARTGEYVACERCGERFYAQQHTLDTAKWCSVECMKKVGASMYEVVRNALPTDWEAARNRAREQAGYECEMCSLSEEKLGRELDGHHIVPVLSGGSNGDRNLMALCRSCHKTAESHTTGLFTELFVG